MVGPLKITGSEQSDLERLVSEARSEIQLTDRLPNLSDKVRHLEEVLERNSAASAQYSGESSLLQLDRDLKGRLFDLNNAEGTLERIEEDLGQGDSEPVDLTVQQTMDLVQKLRQLALTIPNDERLAAVATNVCEGLESFVTDVLSESRPSDDGGETAGNLAASPGDLTMALEVIDTIRTCPGGDRTPVYKSLRQQFIDASCRSAWSRLDRLFDKRLDRAARKQYLHEALTTWTLLPELGENAGSPRLSQLPEDIRRTIQAVFLRDVVGGVPGGDRQGLLDTALLINELAEDYLTMIPAIPVLEAQTALGVQASDTLLRRMKRELSTVDTWRDLEICLSAISILHTIPGMEEDKRFRELSPRIRMATWRLRLFGAMRFFRRIALPVFISLLVVTGLMATYIGVATLVERFYDISIPLAL